MREAVMREAKEVAMSTTERIPALDPELLRGDFPILSTILPNGRPLVYFDNAATTQRPRVVIHSLVDMYEKYYANVHRGVHWLSDQSTDRYEEARGKVQTFIHAPAPEEVIFTRGTTESINLVARSWGDQNVGPQDEILVTEMEHHSNLVPWFQLAQRTGAQVRYIPVTEDGYLDLESLDSLLNSRTKLLAVAATSNVLGTNNPLGDLIARAHAVGALVLVDAAQSVPHQVTDVAALGADFVAFSGHKMMGPTGIGVLYGRRELLDAMPPFQGGGSMIHRVTMQGFEPADLPAKFEAGTPSIVAAVGLGIAIDYLNQVGIDAIYRHEKLLTRAAHDVLGEDPDVRFLGPPPESKGGIVSFTLRNIHAHDVAQLMDREGIAIRAGHHCTQPLHRRLGVTASNRVSFYLYNTLEEVHKLGEALYSVKKVFRRA
jgi:cysteine desulfurase/selenocysteine lyase